MVKRSLLLFLLLGWVWHAEAQFDKGRIKHKLAEVCLVSNFGYYGNPHYGGGANIQYTWGLGRGRQIFNVGAGLRVNTFFTKRRFYQTSSNELVELNRGGADTIYFPKIQTNTLNAYFILQLHIKRGVDFFFTSDIGGINFGDKRKGYFRSYETYPEPPGIEVSTEPYAFNVNMYENNSYGSIMSEAYLSVLLSNFLRYRIGINYLRNEYKVNQPLPMNGNRFSQRHYMVMMGLAFNIRQQKTIYETHNFYYR